MNPAPGPLLGEKSLLAQSTQRLGRVGRMLPSDVPESLVIYRVAPLGAHQGHPLSFSEPVSERVQPCPFVLGKKVGVAKL